MDKLYPVIVCGNGKVVSVEACISGFVRNKIVLVRAEQILCSVGGHLVYVCSLFLVLGCWGCMTLDMSHLPYLVFDD